MSDFNAECGTQREKESRNLTLDSGVRVENLIETANNNRRQSGR